MEPKIFVSEKEKRAVRERYHTEFKAELEKAVELSKDAMKFATETLGIKPFDVNIHFVPQYIIDRVIGNVDDFKKH